MPINMRPAKYTIQYMEAMDRIAYTTCLETDVFLENVAIACGQNQPGANAIVIDASDIAKFRSNVVKHSNQILEDEQNVDLVEEVDACFAALFCFWFRYFEDNNQHTSTASLWVGHPALAMAVFSPFYVAPYNLVQTMTVTEMYEFFHKFEYEYNTDFLDHEGVSTIRELREKRQERAKSVHDAVKSKCQKRARRELCKLVDHNKSKDSTPGALPSVWAPPSFVGELEEAVGISIPTVVE